MISRIGCNIQSLSKTPQVLFDDMYIYGGMIFRVAYYIQHHPSRDTEWEVLFFVFYKSGVAQQYGLIV